MKNIEMSFVSSGPDYFTTSEVGNHRLPGDSWIIEPDGSFGYNVYDISGKLPALGKKYNKH